MFGVRYVVDNIARVLIVVQLHLSPFSQNVHFDHWNLLENIVIFILIFRGQSWRSGQRCDCKSHWLWVRSPLEEMKYLLKFIFPLLHSGVEAKRGVEFCQSIRNAARIRQKMWNRVSYHVSSLCLCAGYSVKLIFFLN